MATFKRQQEANTLAKDVELMIVVGSKSSANTTHLAEILMRNNNALSFEESGKTCKEEALSSPIDRTDKLVLNQNNNIIHIETYKELDSYRDLLSKVNKIGITAGASTPDNVINEVIKDIGDLDS
jgi:4-hydroxy-3-methylbut-2-enyl diphosphate reductase